MAGTTGSPDGQEVVYSICENIAAKTDTDIRELPPLTDAIDPAALRAFIRGPTGADGQPGGSVQFPYCGHRVVVDSTGRVRSIPVAESTPSASSI